MRKLKTSDIFAFSRCIKAIGVKEELQNIANDMKQVKDQEKFGIEVMYKLFELASEKKSEKAIYEFLSGPFEMDPKEIENMALNDLFEELKVFSEDASVLASFFKQLLR